MVSRRQHQYVVLLFVTIGIFLTCGCDREQQENSQENSQADEHKNDVAKSADTSGNTGDASPWPEKLEYITYYISEERICGSSTSLTLVRSGDVRYCYQSAPHTGSGGHVVQKQWNIPKDEIEHIFDSFVSMKINELGKVSTGPIASPSRHYFSFASTGWKKTVRLSRLRDVIWKLVLPLMVHAHPEKWQEDTTQDFPEETDIKESQKVYTPAKWGKVVNGLQTRLEVDTVENGVDQWMTVYLDVRNVSDHPIEVASVWLPPFVIVKRDGKVVDPEEAWFTQKMFLSSFSRTLQPGMEVTSSVKCGRIDRSKPGTYSLHYNSKVPAKFSYKGKYAYTGAIPPPSNEVSFAIKAIKPKKPVPWLDMHEWSGNEIKTRLTSLARKFSAGKPIPMRLEIQGATSGSQIHIKVTGPDSEGVWTKLLSIPAVWHKRKQSAALGGIIHYPLHCDYDLASCINMRKPGKYTVSYIGVSGSIRPADILGNGGGSTPSIPASLPFEIEILPSPVTQADGDPIGKLIDALPGDWVFEFEGDANSIGDQLISPGFGWSRVPGSCKRLYMKRSREEILIRGRGKPIEVYLTRIKAESILLDPRGNFRHDTTYLGGNKHYHVYIHVPDIATQAWPTAHADLRRALRVNAPDQNDADADIPKKVQQSVKCLLAGSPYELKSDQREVSDYLEIISSYDSGRFVGRPSHLANGQTVTRIHYSKCNLSCTMKEGFGRTKYSFTRIHSESSASSSD